MNQLDVHKSKQFINEVRENMLSFLNDFSKGELNQMAKSHFQTPGKFLRSRLIQSLGMIYKVPQKDLLAWATSCELLHEASLVHDDIQDKDNFRRGQPTLWNSYGSAQAINVGDFFLMLAFQPIAGLNPRLSSLLSQTGITLIQGQTEDLKLTNFSHSDDNLENYLSCIRQKTAALFSNIAEGVAILSRLEKKESVELNKLFSQLGVIFQIQDDLLDLYGDKLREAKACDIKEGKLSFLIAIHLDKNPEDFEILKLILKKPRTETNDEDIEKVLKLFYSKGTKLSAIEFLMNSIEEIFSLQVLSENVLLNKEIRSWLSEVLKKINHVLPDQAIEESK